MPVAREMARELGIGFRTELNAIPNYSPVRDPEAVRAARDDAAATPDEYEVLHGQSYYQYSCYQLWDDPQINWDGKVLGCCVNFWGDFGGNAFRDGLTASVNTEQIQYARAMLRGRAPPREDIPCTRCREYQKMSKHGAWLAPRLRNWSRRYVPTIARPTLKKIYWGVYCRAQRWLPKRA